MPRTPAAASLDEAVRQALEPVVVKASAVVAEAIARTVAAMLERELSKAGSRGKDTLPRRRGRPARAPITKWAADRRARRVPNFVIEMTGLRTKKQIVAKYGENAAFEAGKPARRVPEPQAAQEVPKAKGPFVRRKAAAA